MSEQQKCPECGVELPSGAGEAPCPGCLMKLGMESWTERRRGREFGGTAAPTTPLGERFVPPDPAVLAELFPQLEIIELLGQGGMGAVYKARQPGLDRLVAVKILPAEIGVDAAFAERFAREARALARLNHPNIVGVYDYGQAEGLYYFVMEYIDGANLRQLERARSLDSPQALALVSQICDALQFAHDEGIVHRDIKPENILVDRRGRAKIADFGLAKLLDKSLGETALTEERQAMGTLHYMAPEQMAGSRAVDHRADLYSLGVVFYELLTGELPLGRFPLPSKSLHVDVRLDEIVLRSLEREPERRYQRASDIKTDIQSVSDVPMKAQPRSVADSSSTAESSVMSLQVPCVLLFAAGVLNVLPTLFGILAMPLAGAVFGLNVGIFGVAEILIVACVLPIGALQIAASLSLRRRQGWLLGNIAAVISLFPCGIGWLVSVLAGVWLLITLHDPAVKATFQNPTASFVRVQHPSKPGHFTGRRRFSRKAIVGALWAPLFLVLLMMMFSSFVLRGDRPLGPGETVTQPTMLMAMFGLFVLVAGVSPVLGTTMLGALAINDIRNSGGRIVGLPLALADAMLFPLLLLDVLLAAGLLAALRLFSGAANLPVSWIFLPVILLVCLVVDSLLIWLAWQSVRDPAATGHEPQSDQNESSRKDEHRAVESEEDAEQRRNRTVGRVVVAGLIVGLLVGVVLAVAQSRGFVWSAEGRLIEAVRQRDVASVERLLADSPELLETRDVEESTLLNIAALHGDTTIVRLLLARGADVDTMDQLGVTPLVKAARLGHLAVVEELLSHEAHVDHRTIRAETALLLAVEHGHLPVVKELVENGADVNLPTPNRETTLIRAVQQGHQAVIDYLLAQGADIEHRDAEGRSILYYAASDELYRRLRDAGAPVGPAEYFREGYQLALAGQYGEAAQLFEQVLESDSLGEGGNGLQMRIDGWVYETSNERLTIPIFLAACYANADDWESAKQVLADVDGPRISRFQLYCRWLDTPGREVSERYLLDHSEFNRFRQSPNEPLRLWRQLREVNTISRGGSLHESSSESIKSVSGVFH